MPQKPYPTVRPEDREKEEEEEEALQQQLQMFPPEELLGAGPYPMPWASQHADEQASVVDPDGWEQFIYSDIDPRTWWFKELMDVSLLVHPSDRIAFQVIDSSIAHHYSDE